MERSLSLYRDGNLEWNKSAGTLSLKAPQGNDSAKLKKSLKYDFSFANWGEATERWLKGVKKRYATLFPDVSKQARSLAGIKVKGTGTGTESESSESGADSSGRDLDSDYEGLGFANLNLKVSDDNHRDSDHDATGGGNRDTDERLGTDARNHQLEGSASGDNEDRDQQEGNDAGSQHSNNEADNEQDGGDQRDCEEYGEEHLGDEVAGDGDYEMLGAELEGELEHASSYELSESELSNISDLDSGSNDASGKQVIFTEQLCWHTPSARGSLV